MAGINFGPEAIDRAGTITTGRSYINLDNPCNGSGKISTVKLWFNTDATGVKVGSFYVGNATKYTCRAFATIGNVTSGSMQTIPVTPFIAELGDYIGIYMASGLLDRDTTGFAGVYYYVGDAFDLVEHTFTLAPDDAVSVYGEGSVKNQNSIRTNSLSGKLSALGY